MGTTDEGGIDDAQKAPSSNYMKSGEHYDTQIAAWQDRAGNHWIFSPKRDNRLFRRGVGSKGHFHEYNGETGREVRQRSGPVYHYDKGGQTHTTEGHRDDTIRKNNRKVINGDRSDDIGGGRYSNAGKGRITGADKSVLSYAIGTNRKISAAAQQGSMGSGTNVNQSNGDEFIGTKGHFGVTSLDHAVTTTKDRTAMIGGNDNLEVKGDERKVKTAKGYTLEVGANVNVTVQNKVLI